MGAVVRLFDNYTGRFDAACGQSANFIIEDSDDDELRARKIRLQAAFRKMIKDSAILSIMLKEELVVQMNHLVHHVKEHAEIVRASTSYAIAVRGARELATKFAPPVTTEPEVLKSN